MKTSTLTDLAETVSETVSEAVATGADVVQDVATAIVAHAPEVAETVSDKASDLAHRIRSHETQRPWPLIAVVVAIILGVWWLRRRRSRPSDGVRVNDLREHTERARTAAAS
jgi:hypothetical protein